MKRLTALFAGIALIATVPGFALDGMPLLALFGRVTAEIALLGLGMSVAGRMMEQWIAPWESETGETHASSGRQHVTDSSLFPLAGR
jgi:hypothetical protein